MPFTASFFLGKYKILVNSTENAFDEFCDEFNVSGLMKKNVSRCCGRPLTGDSFIIVRTDIGPLRLYEVFLSGMVTEIHFSRNLYIMLS